MPEARSGSFHLQPSDIVLIRSSGLGRAAELGNGQPGRVKHWAAVFQMAADGAEVAHLRHDEVQMQSAVREALEARDLQRAFESLKNVFRG